MMEALLGLDVGTSSTKAVLFDASGKELARATSPPYHNHTPHPGWMEQDPEELWQAVLTAIRGVMVQIGGDVNVRAMCTAAQSGSLLPADANGEPVYPLITWMDGRTEALVRQWREEGIEKQVKSISGWSLYPGLCLPTIAWLRHNNADTFTAACYFFSVNDFILLRLTGEACTNPSNGGGMQLVDIQTGEWSERLCELAGITTGQLSPIRPSGARIRRVRAEVSRATGLPSDTMVVNGGHDQGCTALGLGVTEPGKVLLASGTAWVITGVIISPDMTLVPDTLDLNFHPAPGRWTTSQSLGGLGASLEWWVNQTLPGVADGAARQERFAAIDNELAGTNPGCGGLLFLPLTGGHDDPATTRRGGFVGLHIGHMRADMTRSILESAAFELRWALGAILQAGLPVESLWMVGGATRSRHWPSTLANVTGVPICLPAYDNWPALGAAVLAGVGVGVFENIEDGLARFQTPIREIVPDEELKHLYDASFSSYQRHIRAFRQKPIL